ncbi:MAG: hypothetical protein ACI9YT_001349 [Halobacteriales archaeon]|jgi:hypothetical protein
MTDWERVWRLSRAMIGVEIEARNKWMAIAPVGVGLLFLAIVGAAIVEPSTLTGTTQSQLDAALDNYFTSVSGPKLAIALVVVQAPMLLSLFAPIVTVPTARSLAGRRVKGGEFETLLAAPQTHGELFATFVLTAFVVTLVQVLVLAVIGIGGAWILVLVAGAEFTLSAGPATFAPYIVPLPVALWAALVSTLVYMAYPDTSLNGHGVGNFLLLVAYLPGFALLGIVSVAPGISPLLVAVGGFLIVSVLTAIGAAAVRKWFRPVRVL